MVYATKTSNGAICYLIAPKNVREFISLISQAQTKAKTFCNVSTRPYKGNKYDSSFIWVCVG